MRGTTREHRAANMECRTGGARHCRRNSKISRRCRYLLRTTRLNKTKGRLNIQTATQRVKNENPLHLNCHINSNSRLHDRQSDSQRNNYRQHRMPTGRLRFYRFRQKPRTHWRRPRSRTNRPEITMPAIIILALLIIQIAVERITGIRFRKWIDGTPRK